MLCLVGLSRAQYNAIENGIEGGGLLSRAQQTATEHGIEGGGLLILC